MGTLSKLHLRTLGTSCLVVLWTSLAMGFTSPFPSTVEGLSIPNAHSLSAGNEAQVLFRSQRPFVERRSLRLGNGTNAFELVSETTQTYFDELVDLGITDILIFKHQTHGEVDNQIEWMEFLNDQSEETLFSYSHIPFPWKDISDFEEICDFTLQGLRLMRSVQKSKDRKLLIHCTVGEDRTGVLAGLWRMLDQGWTQERAFQEEMCQWGFAAGNPRKPYRQVVAPLRANLTPLFVALAQAIEKGTLTKRRMRKSICQSIAGTVAKMPRDKTPFRCKASPTAIPKNAD